MSLIGLDGQPISFDTPATAAAAAAAGASSKPAPFLISTFNKFLFETPPAAAPAAAAAAFLPGGLFSSQPVLLSPQHQQQESPFAPSMPQRSTQQSVKIDFSEFEEVSALQDLHCAELSVYMHRNCMAHSCWLTLAVVTSFSVLAYSRIFVTWTPPPAVSSKST